MAQNSNTDSVARIFSLSALSATQTDQQITVTEDIGGIPAGTVYPEGTSLTTIITQMLQGSGPVVNVTTYNGATDNPPVDLTGLTQEVVSSTTLLGGYQKNIKAGNITTKTGQHPVFAIPRTYEVTKWAVVGFDYNIPHTKVVTDEYNIYYLNVPTYDEDLGGVNYQITVQEV